MPSLRLLMFVVMDILPIYLLTLSIDPIEFNKTLVHDPENYFMRSIFVIRHKKHSTYNPRVISTLNMSEDEESMKLLVLKNRNSHPPS